MLAVAHAPRVVNEAFDSRTVNQLQLDQLTQDLKLKPEDNTVKNPTQKERYKMTHLCVPVRSKETSV